MRQFKLIPAVADLVAATKAIREHYGAALRATGSEVELKFTLDGNLVGDFGEAIAAEKFGIKLVETRSTEGIDGYAPDGRTVQVKATGTGRGPAFRQTETRADHLLFFELDFENATGFVVYNGPEHHAVAMLPDVFTGQRSLTKTQIRAADKLVAEADRLTMISP